MIHEIPESEREYHVLSMGCPCEPAIKITDNEILVVHNPIRAFEVDFNPIKKPAMPVAGFFNQSRQRKNFNPKKQKPPRGDEGD